MSDRGQERDSGRKPLRDRSAALALAVSVIISASPGLFAWADAPHGDPEAARTTTNLGVALEPGENVGSEPEGAANPGVSATPASTGTPTAAATPSGIASSAAAAKADKAGEPVSPGDAEVEQGRLVKPRGTAARLGIASDGKEPWYRTGLGALAVILCVIGLAYLAVRRWIPGGRVADQGVLRVVSRTALGPKHTAALIQVGRRFVLIGVAPERVSMLCDISDEEEVAELSARCGSSTAGNAAFDRLLAGEAASFQGGSAPGEDLPKRGRSVPTRLGRPVKELLGRLRALQAR